MRFFNLPTSLLLLFTLSNAVVVTTTLSPAAQTSAAVINQEAMLENIIEDIFESTSLLKYITSANYDVATSFISFMVDIYSYSATEFPTSIFVDAFPFEEFKSIFSRLPNRDNILSSYGATDLRVPSDYAVLIITETDQTIERTESTSRTSHYFLEVEETSSSNTETVLSSFTTSTASATTKSSVSSTKNDSSALEISSISATTLLNSSSSFIIPKTLFLFLFAFIF